MCLSGLSPVTNLFFTKNTSIWTECLPFLWSMWTFGKLSSKDTVFLWYRNSIYHLQKGLREQKSVPSPCLNGQNNPVIMWTIPMSEIQNSGRFHYQHFPGNHAFRWQRYTPRTLMICENQSLQKTPLKCTWHVSSQALEIYLSASFPSGQLPKLEGDKGSEQVSEEHSANSCFAVAVHWHVDLLKLCKSFTSSLLIWKNVHWLPLLLCLSP